MFDKDDHEKIGLPLKTGLERDMSGKSLDSLIIQYYVMKVDREPSTDRAVIVTSSRNGGLWDFWKTEEPSGHRNLEGSLVRHRGPGSPVPLF